MTAGDEQARPAQRPRPAGAVSAEQLGLRIIETEATPLYLQIVLQLKQLIMTGQLADGVRLPAVRALAVHLGINPGTVMQAYRELASEGLTASVRGRGSVVRTLSGRSDDLIERERVLDAAAARLAVRARALGFDPVETQQRVGAALLSAREPVPVVFLGLTTSHARRYTDELNETFSGVRFLPYSMADVVARDPDLLAELDTAYTVMAFAPRVPEVERALTDVPVEIVGVRAEITERSREALARLEPGRSYTVVTERRAVTTFLALLDVEPELVLAGDEEDPIPDEVLAEVARGASVLVYSFGVRDAVRSLGLPDDRLVELEFDFTESTWRYLHERWGSAPERFTRNGR